MEPVVLNLCRALPFPVQIQEAEVGHERDARLLEDNNPQTFWRGLIPALASGRKVFLSPSRAGSHPPDPLSRMDAHATEAAEGALFIPTSGTSGRPRHCHHSLSTLQVAAEGFREAFGECCPHALVCLPQHHVGGLLPVFRAAACGGQVCFTDYKDPGQWEKAPFPLGEASLSLVPTMLEWMRRHPSCLPVLKRIERIFIGGAAASPELLAWARREGLRLSPAYGSTETGAMVTALPPEAFLDGLQGCGFPLPHARIAFTGDGRITVASAANLLAYLPAEEGFARQPFVTSDIGAFNEGGSLDIFGRMDRVINSGGEKIHPERIEALVLASGKVKGCRCEGVPDPYWGQRIELFIEPAEVREDPRQAVREFLRERLPAWACPKEIRLGNGGRPRGWKG